MTPSIVKTVKKKFFFEVLEQVFTEKVAFELLSKAKGRKIFFF